MTTIYLLCICGLSFIGRLSAWDACPHACTTGSSGLRDCAQPITDISRLQVICASYVTSMHVTHRGLVNLRLLPLHLHLQSSLHAYVHVVSRFHWSARCWPARDLASVLSSEMHGALTRPSPFLVDAHVMHTIHHQAIIYIYMCVLRIHTYMICTCT